MKISGMVLNARETRKSGISHQIGKNPFELDVNTLKIEQQFTLLRMAKIPFYSRTQNTALT